MAHYWLNSVKEYIICWWLDSVLLARGSLHAQVVIALLNKAPQQALSNLPSILPAVISKLVSAKSLPLITGLLAICAQLTLTSAHQFIDYLASLPRVPGTGKKLCLGFPDIRLPTHLSWECPLPDICLFVPYCKSPYWSLTARPWNCRWYWECFGCPSPNLDWEANRISRQPGDQAFHSCSVRNVSNTSPDLEHHSGILHFKYLLGHLKHSCNESDANRYRVASYSPKRVNGHVRDCLSTFTLLH